MPRSNRPLTPWLVCLAVLLVLDVPLRVWVDRAYPFWHDRLPADRVQWDQIAIDQVIAGIRHDRGRKIVVLGDSVMAAHGLPYWATTSGLLAQHWRRHDSQGRTRVYDLAMDASRPGDEFAVLFKVIAAHPDIVVIEMNVQMFSRAQAEEIPFSYPYLHRVVQQLPAYQAAAKRLRLPETDPREDAISHAAQGAWALYRYRELLDGLLIGGAPLERLRGAPPVPIAVLAEPTSLYPGVFVPWYDRHDVAYFHSQMGQAYVDTPFDAYPNPSLFFADQIVRYLNGHHVRAVVFLTPVNHGLIDPVVAPAAYAAHVQRLNRIFEGQSFVYLNAQAALPDRFFLDDDHLTPMGHVRLADALYQAMRPYGATAGP